jgi:hypothetical protein
MGAAPVLGQRYAEQPTLERDPFRTKGYKKEGATLSDVAELERGKVVISGSLYKSC